MKTFNANPENVKRNWHIVDANEQVLGRLASAIAFRLRGKHKPEFDLSCDVGDFIIVLNVDKIRVTGKKTEDKKYYHHTGFPGGIKETNFIKMQRSQPARLLELAVKGMLPKNSLGRAMYRKLKIYAGTEHPHEAQQPELIAIT